MANLVTVSAKDESAFLASSSINMIRLDNALTSSSAFLKAFPSLLGQPVPWSICHWFHQTLPHTLESSFPSHECQPHAGRFLNWPPWCLPQNEQWWSRAGQSQT